MLLLYKTFLTLYRLSIQIASLWNKKAQLWIVGRNNIFSKLKDSLIQNNSPIVWMHCSSLGEFEQGRPLLEAIRKENSSLKIMLTFFSPSGYEIRKDYEAADWIFYLPMDGKTTAHQFLEIVKPSLAIFIKYEFWYFYLAECKKRGIPLLLVAGIFRNTQPFFRMYGGFHRKMLACFTHFFVQDEPSKKLLTSIQFTNCSISGDTRFDRVVAIHQAQKKISIIETFISNSKVLVAGSTWHKDETLLCAASNSLRATLKVIIAPHEIHHQHVTEIQSLFSNSILLSDYAKLNTANNNFDCLIIDEIGMLAHLYQYATITYIGGGFNKGIHNTLEAAVQGKPVLFGPNFKKFNEAKKLLEQKAAFSISTSHALELQLKNLLEDTEQYNRTCKTAKEFVLQQQGATQKIISFIQENRLLINS